jgi:hypothetical protein
MARRHRLFAITLGLAVVPRLVVMAGFMPAALFKLDTYDSCGAPPTSCRTR